MDRSDLINAAWDARKKAHAPYSQFAVGAAILTGSGQIFKGCNVENISFRLTVCAEEIALGAAIVNGHTDLVAVAVVADSEHPIVPCGGCRQLLAEFNPDLEIVSATRGGTIETYSLRDLLPRPKQGILEKRNES